MVTTAHVEHVKLKQYGFRRRLVFPSYFCLFLLRASLDQSKTSTKQKTHHMIGYTFGRLQGQAKWPTGTPIQLPLKFVASRRSCLTKKTRYKSSDCSAEAIRRSSWLICYCLEKSNRTHTHTQILYPCGTCAPRVNHWSMEMWWESEHSIIMYIPPAKQLAPGNPCYLSIPLTWCWDQDVLHAKEGINKRTVKITS